MKRRMLGRGIGKRITGRSNAGRSAAGRRGTSGRPALDSKQILGLQILLCGMLLLAVLTLQRLETPAAQEAYNHLQTALTRNVTAEDLQEGVKSAWNTVKTGGKAVWTAVRSAGDLRLSAPADGDAILAASVNATGEDTGQMLVYAAEEGEMQVYAAAGGTVLETLDLGQGSFLIRISHGNDAVTDYQGTGTVYAKPLEKVKKGQLIAAVSGDLFFSLSMEGEPRNPLEYLK